MQMMQDDDDGHALANASTLSFKCYGLLKLHHHNLINSKIAADAIAEFS